MTMSMAGPATDAIERMEADIVADRGGAVRLEAQRKLRRLAKARSQLPGLVDMLAIDHHEALLDRLELRINEAAEAARRAALS